MFKKILIANRGEIAVRVIRACKEWGIATVAVHSDVDRDSMHVRLADESVCIGSHQPANSYLNVPALMSAIELTKAEAVHPGYGFLSENANFAKVLEENNIKFIGASSKLIGMMGDKIQAKKIAKEHGLPVIEGSEGGVTDIKDALIKTGNPIFLQSSLAAFTSVTPPSEPSITGRPCALAIFFAWILSPIISISFEDAPINLILFSSKTLAKLAFSDKKPYPGWTASAFVSSIADINAGTFK